MAFRIDRCTFYKRVELVSSFGEMGADWDALAARMRIPKRHRNLFFGGDIIDAWSQLPDLREHQEVAQARTGNIVDLPKSQPCNSKKHSQKKKLLAGLWTPQEVGL